MELTSVRQGDIVECNVKGRRFFALVEQRRTPGQALAQGGALGVRPITAGITYRNIKAVEVIGHYKRSKQSARAREEAAA